MFTVYAKPLLSDKNCYPPTVCARLNVCAANSTTTVVQNKVVEIVRKVDVRLPGKVT